MSHKGFSHIGLSTLEYCCFTRELGDNDARMQDRFELSVRRLGLEDPAEIR